MKKFQKAFLASMLSFSMVAPVTVVPTNAYAAQSQYDRRQKTKNEWRNIAIGSGVLGLLGLINKDRTLTFAGTAGALYSAWRYEQDRKSQSKMARYRAQLFSRSSFTRDGYLYTRHTKYKNGKKYYYFTKSKLR